MLQLPLSFTNNQGQTDASVKYFSQGPGYTLFLTSQGLVLSLKQGQGSSAQSAVISMQVVGANVNPTVTGVDQLAGTSNYYVGDASQWQTKVANYGKVSYQNLYPGVDAVFYGNQRQIEYDFQLAPGANPGVIRLGFQGQQSMSIDAQGNLLLHTAGGDVVENAPVVYQTINGLRQSVAGRFVIENDGQVGFAIGAYDTSKPLTIDPLLSYSSFLGGQGGDVAAAAVVDSKGNLWVTGTTNSIDFPSRAVKQPMQSGNSEPSTPTNDAFVIEINGPIKTTNGTTPAGTQILYSAYYGGIGITSGTSIAIDSFGDVVVGGVTNCFNLVTGAFGSPAPPFFGANAYQEVNGGSSANPQDGFVLELTSNQVLNFATYLGGSASDSVSGVAIDSQGNVDVTGTTFSSDFPVTTGLTQTRIGGQNDAFLVQLNATGTAENFGTFLGGSSNDFAKAITLDGNGNIYVAGQTFSSDFPTRSAIQSTLSGNSSAFVTKFTSSGAIAYSTYLGGPNGNSQATAITTDASGNVFLTGATSSSDFPTAGNAFQTAFGVQGTANQTDAFVTKINSTGSNLVYSTYLGAASTQAGSVGNGIVVDSSDDAIVIGTTDSSTFPTKLPIQRNLLGARDAFVTKLSADGSALGYSTYLGGSTVADANGNPTNIPADNEGLAIAYNATASPQSVYIVGATDAYLPGAPFADSFPTYAPLEPNGPFIQTKYNKGGDAFVAELSDTDQILNLNDKTDTLVVPEGTVSFNVTITGVITGAGIITLNGIGEPTDTFFTLTGAYAVAPVPATMLANPGTILVNFVENGISNQLRISVVDAPLEHTPNAATYTYTAVEGIPNANNQVVATFVDDNANSSVSQFPMSRVNWGDGTPAEAVAIYLLSRSNNQAFYQVVAGGHTYAHPGSYTVTTTINDKFGSTLSSSQTTVVVSDASLTDTTPSTAYTAQQGISTPLLLVGTFSDASSKAQVGDYSSATIHWGDGTTSAGTISPGSTPGTFLVSGSHNYTKVGNQSVSVAVLDSGGSTVTTGNVSVFVNPAAVTNLTTQTALTGVAGLDTAGLVATTPLVIASFRDANPNAAISDFDGSTISWGDGTTSLVQLQIAQSGSSTIFNVINDHVYSQAGVFAVTISLQNQGSASLQIPLTDTISAASVNAVSATEGFPLQMVIATFSDPNQALVVSKLSATIAWGDGQTSAGTVASDNRGGFMIQGSHTYLTVGGFNASVTIFGSNGSSLTLNTVASIVDAPIQTQGVSFAATANSAFTGTVATFTSAGVANPASNFSAAIAWGDGHTSVGTVTATGNGTYTVAGTNTYAQANTYQVSATITDKAGSTAIASSTARVSGSTGGGPPAPGFGELTAVTTGTTSTVFAISPTNMLFRHDNSGWVVLGANIIQVSASAQANGLAVVFAVTGDHGLFRFDNMNGWQPLGAPGTIASVSAGTDSNGNADAFVLTVDGTFTEYRASTGWIGGALGGRGTILSMSAANFDRVVVVAADHAISEFDPHFGWFPLTSSGFAKSLSAVGDARGFVDVFAQTLDGSLFVYQPQAGWARIGGSGSIAAVSAGLDTTGQADAVVITTSSGLLEYRVRSGWSQFFPPAASAVELSATASDRVFMTFGDGSIFSEDPTLGISQIAGPGFAHL